MHINVITRLPVHVEPPYDCIDDNEHCPFCARDRAKPDATLAPIGYHGRHPGTIVFMVRTVDDAGAIAGLALDVFGIKYRKEIRARVPELVSTPRGAVLVIHRDATIVTPANPTDCRVLGDGRPCEAETWGFGIASDIYARFGVITRDADVDLTIQPDALWHELERLLALHLHGAARESA